MVVYLRGRTCHEGQMMPDGFTAGEAIADQEDRAGQAHATAGDSQKSL
jgi:hypothetical protein